jgi:hypothetical protein
LIFSQSVDRPDRYREDSRFDTTPSSPIRQTPWNMSSSVFCDSTIPRLRLPMSEESLPIREGERPQVLASELQQVEGVQHRLADDPAPMNVFEDCDAVTSAPDRQVPRR